MDDESINLTKVRVLIANDDGIDAPGLQLLEDIANSLFDEVWVVAPTSEQSAAGHSLTLRRPLRIHKRGERRFAVNGTPTDCVLLAVNRRYDLFRYNSRSNGGYYIRDSGHCSEPRYE